MSIRFLIIISILVLSEYYSFILIRSMIRSMPAAGRIPLFALYILVTIMAWLGFIFIRQLNWANMPHLLRNIFIGFVLGMMVGKLLITVVMLIDDIRRLLTWLICAIAYKTPAGSNSTSMDPIDRSLFLKRTAIVLGGLSLAGFIAGIRNRYNYRVRKIKVNFTSLPPAFKGLKIVQISDIHTGSFDNHEAVAHGVERIMYQQPDMIVFTGDLVNNKADEVDEKYQEIFSRLKAPMGVYSTLGNHDYGDYVQWPTNEHKVANLNQLKNTHARMGWRLLMNEHIVFERGDQKIALVGIENWGAKANFPKYGSMKKATEGLKEKQVPFQILLSHDPSHWDAEVLPEYKDINLMLAGHTHGMQFGIDSKIFKWSPVQYMYKQWAGLYGDGEQKLYVNRGFGFLGYPGRLGILPEITVLEFA